MVPADRMPVPSRRRAAAGRRGAPLLVLSSRSHQGRASSPRRTRPPPTVARALKRFRHSCRAPPPPPAFRSGRRPALRRRDLREWLPAPLDDHDISLDLAGLGVAQIYWILGQAMLSGARIIGIEEPEAHLHAPTTGSTCGNSWRGCRGEAHRPALHRHPLQPLRPRPHRASSTSAGERRDRRDPQADLDPIDDHL